MVAEQAGGAASTGDMRIFEVQPKSFHERFLFFFQAEDGIRDYKVTGVQTCALPISTRDPEEMWRELRGFAAAIANPHLHKLLDDLLDDQDIARRYRVAPAAKQIHHAYLGGLIEHVLSLCHLSRMAASHYPSIDGDLLVTGAIVHDIGKIFELSYERGFSYSDEGQLLGHMLIAVRMIGEKLHDIPDFPPRLRSLVEHMILSHHGQLEF